jgi:hypothetical protein
MLRVGRGGGITKGGERPERIGVGLEFLDEVKRGNGGSPSKRMSISDLGMASQGNSGISSQGNSIKRRLSFSESVANRL